MPRCAFCGKEFRDEDTVFCPYCGKTQSPPHAVSPARQAGASRLIYTLTPTPPEGYRVNAGEDGKKYDLRKKTEDKLREYHLEFRVRDGAGSRSIPPTLVNIHGKGLDFDGPAAFSSVSARAKKEDLPTVDYSEQYDISCAVAQPCTVSTPRPIIYKTTGAKPEQLNDAKLPELAPGVYLLEYLCTVSDGEGYNAAYSVLFRLRVKEKRDDKKIRRILLSSVAVILSALCLFAIIKKTTEKTSDSKTETDAVSATRPDEKTTQQQAELSAEDIASAAVGDMITLGSYPQNEVTDAGTIAALEQIEKTWQSYGYYSGTGAEDGQMQPGDWMRFADFDYQGEKYRAVIFDEYRPAYTFESMSDSNGYQEENGYSAGNVYYFRYDPLRWRVLDPAAGLIVCQNVIDSQPYQNLLYTDEAAQESFLSSGSAVYTWNYAESSLRDWLNADFYTTAFSEADRSRIELTPLKNTSSDAKYAGADTNDAVFLLSGDDLWETAYGFSGKASDQARIAYPSDYAKCQGIYIDAGSISNDYPSDVQWWLRTPQCISEDGIIDVFYSSTGVTSCAYIGVRPALRLTRT